MKKTLLNNTLILAILLLCSFSLYGQKKPTIVVFPADVWCNTNGYVTHSNNMGKDAIICDYKKVFQNDRSIRGMIGGIENFMQENNFPIENLEQQLKNLEDDEGDLMLSISKDGSTLAEDPKDKLLSKIKPDIILDLDFTITKMGPKQQIDFQLKALDAFTGKTISDNQGHGTPSSPSEITNQIQEAVLSFKDKFLTDLMRHANDINVNGREIIVDIRRWDSCPFDFEDEFGDDELSTIIEDWLTENTVKGSYTPDIESASRLRFKQVRIPKLNAKGNAQTAGDWGKRELAKFIKKTTGAECKVEPRGLGQVIITVGGK